MKNTMDKDTILFVMKHTSYAFDFNHYNKNYPSIAHLIEDPSSILYKFSDDTTSWIDFKRAIQLQTGTLKERLEKAYADPNFKIKDLRKIPACVYVDRDGYQFDIPPYDGYYDNAHWMERVKFKDDEITYEFKGDDLQVTFSTEDNINDAMISLNSFFYYYDVINFHTVIFRNVKRLLTTVKAVDEDREYYEIRIVPYAWKGINKQPVKFPIKKELGWFVMEHPIEENCLITYNGLMYEYELDYGNKRRFKLLNVSPSAIGLFNIDSLAVHEMESIKPNMECRKFITRGVGNVYLNSVDFSLPVRNSLILFNGVDSEYEIMGIGTVMYPDTLYAVTSVSNLSFITSINFTRG